MRGVNGASASRGMASAAATNLALPIVKDSTTVTGVTLSVEPKAGGKAEELSAEVVLVAIGRRPFTQGLGLEAAGVAMDRGFVKIDAHYKTNVDGIYAIGDVVRGPMLAHKAVHEAHVAAEVIAGELQWML